MNNLRAISPADGRYASTTKPLQDYFSEYALIRYRVLVEIKYLIALSRLDDPSLPRLNENHIRYLLSLLENFDPEEAAKIKKIEQVTNHDVKAVEYWLKEKIEEADLGKWKEFIHFGLTSQDVNNTAIPLMIRDGLNEVILPQMKKILRLLEKKAADWAEIPMLAKTHGQPASPTRLGKEIEVFAYRLRNQLTMLEAIPVSGKFGGATGNFNAHKAAYPQQNWKEFAQQFLENDLGIQRQEWTTQIENYDDMAALFQALSRINTILIDLCRDIWQYISMEYFKQKIVAGEVGSSAMPHKVNPIDFENAEGNLGIANALFQFLAGKLPVSRLQRDLTDSTVTRNIGLPMAHTLIALRSIEKGMGKILLNEPALNQDLDQNWAVVAEALQNILRREGYPNPYETLKDLTRTGETITQQTIHDFIKGLEVSEEIKSEMRRITPFNYTGF